jgi:TolB protein
MLGNMPAVFARIGTNEPCVAFAAIMTGKPRYLTFGLGAAVAIYLGVCAGLAVCFAAGMNEQLALGLEQRDAASYQPSRFIPLKSLQLRKGSRAADSRRLVISARAATFNSELVPVKFEHNGLSLVDMRRPDGSLKVRIPLQGSLQSPAWSPDGKSVVFTRFRNGYNEGPADVYTFNLETNNLRPLLADGSDNVSQPGSTWNARTGKIAISSDRDGHEEIWTLSANGRGGPQKVTSRSSRAAYEPSFAPDGQSLVFESRDVGNESRGQITIFEISSQGRYIDITAPDGDCRQPNWSPRGDHIVYQKQLGGQWDIWLYDIKSKQHRSLTGALVGDKTDASFSSNGRFIVYSGTAPETDDASDHGDESVLVLPIAGGRPIPLTRHPGYHGAPSWSPDGGSVIAESSTQSPDGTAGTELIITPVHNSMVQQALD